MKKVLIAISGGIAAYKVADVISKLKKHHEVRVMTTKKALDFITPTVIGALSGHYITETDVNEITHIDEAQNCDLFVCVPATANIIAKFANGIADAKNQEEAIGIFSRNTKHQLNSNRKFEILCHKLEDIPVMTL